MRRCIQLAHMGASTVAPNPMVGAVLVHNDRIIGEGYHEKFGEAHAEVNCLNSVCLVDVELICKSILYVSLEPCSHFGKTPPCVDLILKHNIPHVIIGCLDSFEKVNGTGIQKLLNAGVRVETGVLKDECVSLNNRFFTFHQKKQPYIILKWAQSKDGFIAAENGMPVKISNEFTNKLSHKWRSEEAAILVGTNTVMNDDPTLTTRNWSGKNPLRVIIDMDVKINSTAKVFNDDSTTFVFNSIKMEQLDNIYFYKVENQENVLYDIVKVLYQNNILSCIIEGGAHTLQSFIDAGIWDEARVITNNDFNLENGIKAPLLKNALLQYQINIQSDRIHFFTKNINEPL